tara:strand:+ start:918 stop:1106 length:189 start_codon:yes stop_codon:yes gene_type:complete
MGTKKIKKSSLDKKIQEWEESLLGGPDAPRDDRFDHMSPEEYEEWMKDMYSKVQKKNGKWMA